MDAIDDTQRIASNQINETGAYISSKMDTTGSFFTIVILILLSIGLLAKFGEQSLTVIILSFFLLVGASFINVYIY